MKNIDINEKLKIDYINIEKLIPYENNPRINENSVEETANSIKEFGFKNPILVNEKLVIIAGHTRLKASQRLGLEKAPVIVIKGLTEEQENALRLADNKTGELSYWDFEKLIKEIDEIETIDLENFGFDYEELEAIGADNPVVEDDFEVDIDEEAPTRSHQGELWKLGRHRLLVGDSTDPQAVKRLMGGQVADLVLTDPPYNVNVKHGDELQIQNDAMEEKEFKRFLVKAFKNFKDHLKPGGAFYIWHASMTARVFEEALIECNLQIRQQLIWNKNIHVLGREDYHWKHEPAFYGWKDGAPHYFIDSRIEKTVQENQIPVFNQMKKAELIELLEQFYNPVSTTVLDGMKPVTAVLHPTIKPVKLFGRLIRNSSRKGEIVLDLFGGAGTTLIASEQLERSCYIMELDPIYSDVIIERWEELTGEEAELLED